jgi:hypothetical protein
VASTTTIEASTRWRIGSSIARDILRKCIDGP